MTTVTIYNDKAGKCIGFQLIGHAGYSKKGPDIVCAAISMLVTNTINSIETFTSDFFSYEENESDGYMKLMLDGEPGEDTLLLLNSMILGLSELSKNFKKNVTLKTEEV
jgi:hypothetical protein